MPGAATYSQANDELGVYTPIPSHSSWGKQDLKK